MITKMSTSFRPLPNLHRRAIHSMHKKHRKDSLSRRGIHGILMEGRSSFSVAKTLSSSSPICTIEGMYSDPINYRNLNNLGRKRFTRLFGSKRGVPGNPIGTVAIYNEQETLQDIDEAAIERTVKRISKLLGYETYDVTLLLVDDEEMRETNLESRGIDSPTDILSFPFHMCRENQPGVLEDPEFDIPDYYTLGDMVICVPYVIRRCEEDALIFNEKQVLDGTTDGRTVDDDGSECEDDESDLYDDDDRGVSGAMAGVSDPERRIRMLLIHGMLHLVGYDHIEDDDYIEMVAREEELLRELGEL